MKEKHLNMHISRNCAVLPQSNCIYITMVFTAKSHKFPPWTERTEDIPQCHDVKGCFGLDCACCMTE